MPYNSRTNKETRMITDEQILELADDFLEEWGANDQDGNTWKEYSGTTKDIIEFARAIYEQGRFDGFDSGYDSAFYEHGGY